MTLASLGGIYEVFGVASTFIVPVSFLTVFGVILRYRMIKDPVLRDRFMRRFMIIFCSIFVFLVLG